MNITISDTKHALGEKASKAGAQAIKQAMREKSEIAIIVATGASQFEMLDCLIKEDIDWSRVTIFHLDEYIGLDETHPASFRRYLQERLVDKLPMLHQFIGVNGSAADIGKEIQRLNEIIAQYEIDVCFAGIGENAHLAFNDPPADFHATSAYLVVNLDEDCRRQQLGEKWFASLDEVPKQAISMSIPQIMRSKSLILSIPDLRKAMAVKNTLEGEITPRVPASIVQNHAQCQIFLDQDSASLLSKID
ncbi:glucosamine-6-phosphate deaminase [Providencia vermicola]|uniref:glucosamine-6-phosphate deaminase n=1 Tax=Providencia vermicola TaxID=333965 RepID=UPI001CEDFB55|nr:glucosamine-6-phosphate deaminase [Providencia vermicola]